MGKRFLQSRYRLEKRYNHRRASLRLNEKNVEPHQMKPYGLGERGFSCRSLFQKKHQSRQGNLHEKRMVKKAARQRARRQLRENQE